MKFSYKQINDDTHRPIIPVQVSTETDQIRYEVLVDSGADINVFDASLTEVLGIDLESGREETFAGVSGEKRICYFHPIKLEVGGWEYETDAGFTPLPAHAHGIVGQANFFTFFKVTFDYSKKQLKLKRKED